MGENAKTRPVLTETADKIVALLPEDAAATIDAWIKSKASATRQRGAGRRIRRADGRAPDPAPAPPPRPRAKVRRVGVGADKQKLDAIINKRAAAGPAATRPCRPADRASADAAPSPTSSDVRRFPPDPGATGIDLDDDRLHEECGVFGIFGHPDAAAIVALGLHALQHRGQEAAGIVAFDGQRFHSERRLGLVGDHFSSAATIDRLPGSAAVGHVRYSTTGETMLRNVQPLFAELDAGRPRRRPQRQPDQRPDAEARTHSRRRDLPVDDRHRGRAAAGGAIAPPEDRRPLRRGAGARSRAPMRWSR